MSRHTNFDDRNDKYVWDILGYSFTDDDFDEMFKILEERREYIRDIENATVYAVPFNDKERTSQPRYVEDYEKDQLHKYTNWSSAVDLMKIVTKYCDIYSKNNN